MKVFLAIAATLGGLSVAAGAFASHALHDLLTDRALATFETGVRYQMYHALALLGVAAMMAGGERPQLGVPWLRAAGWAFVVGVGLFSGSLYLMSVLGLRTLGLLTPVGGGAFLVGWGCLAIAALRGSASSA